MNSLDTNILVYAANADAPEHQKAMQVVSAMLANPNKWILADQVLFEFYRAIRNPNILQYPLSASHAAERLQFLRNETGIRFCWYESKIFPAVLHQIGQPDFPYQRTHDAILAATLIANGVQTFYTRNQKDFASAGFTHLINPID